MEKGQDCCLRFHPLFPPQKSSTRLQPHDAYIASAYAQGRYMSSPCHHKLQETTRPCRFLATSSSLLRGTSSTRTLIWANVSLSVFVLVAIDNAIIVIYLNPFVKNSLSFYFFFPLCLRNDSSSRLILGPRFHHRLSPVEAEMAAFWRCQYHRMTTKNSSSCRMEPVWSFGMRCVLRTVAESKKFHCLSPEDHEWIPTVRHSFSHYWSLVSLWSRCKCAWLFLLQLAIFFKFCLTGAQSWKT